MEAVPIEPGSVCCRVERRAGRAAVLGATIAFGSCTLAACGDLSDDAAKMPLLAAASLPSYEEEGGVDEVALALEAAEGSVATITAAPGFTPDPLVRTGTTGEAAIDAREVDERCRGWVSAQPDVVITAERPFAELAVMAAASEDITLLVIDPEGEARCGDDEDGTHPVVRGLFEVGTHRVWLGTASPSSRARFVLALSELDDTLPSRLLH